MAAAASSSSPRSSPSPGTRPAASTPQRLAQLNPDRNSRVPPRGALDSGFALEPRRSEQEALIIDVHHKKGRGAIEDKSRGTTGLPGATDINVEVERVGGRTSRQRRLTAQGRIGACFWQRVIELSEDGTEYVSIPSSDEADAQTEGKDEQNLWAARCCSGAVRGP
jgi:hypothetical protein